MGSPSRESKHVASHVGISKLELGAFANSDKTQLKRTHSLSSHAKIFLGSGAAAGAHGTAFQEPAVPLTGGMTCGVARGDKVGAGLKTTGGPIGGTLIACSSGSAGAGVQSTLALVGNGSMSTTRLFRRRA